MLVCISQRKHVHACKQSAALLKEDPIQAIGAGTFAPGSQLPSRRELGVRCGLSHTAERKVIGGLPHSGCRAEQRRHGPVWPCGIERAARGADYQRFD